MAEDKQAKQQTKQQIMRAQMHEEIIKLRSMVEREARSAQLQRIAVMARQQVAGGFNPAEQDQHGETLLHQLVRENDSEVVQVLCRAVPAIRSTIDLPANNSRQSTPLLAAIDAGNENMVRALCAVGADVNMTIPGKFSPLAKAILKDNERIMALLLVAGASLQPNSGFALVALAVRNGKDEALEALLTYMDGLDAAERRALIDAQDKNGNTALHVAVSEQNATAVRLLLQHGADYALVNQQKQSALMCAQSIAQRTPLQKAGDIEQALLAAAKRDQKMAPDQAELPSVDGLSAAEQQRLAQLVSDSSALDELGKIMGQEIQDPAPFRPSAPLVRVHRRPQSSMSQPLSESQPLSDELAKLQLRDGERSVLSDYRRAVAGARSPQPQSPSVVRFHRRPRPQPPSSASPGASMAATPVADRPVPLPQVDAPAQPQVGLLRPQPVRQR